MINKQRQYITTNHSTIRNNTVTPISLTPSAISNAYVHNLRGSAFDMFRLPDRELRQAIVFY